MSRRWADATGWILRSRSVTATGLYVERVTGVFDDGAEADWWRVVLDDDMFVMAKTRGGALRAAMVPGAIAKIREPLRFTAETRTRRLVPLQARTR